MTSERIDGMLASVVVAVVTVTAWSVTGPCHHEWVLADGSMAYGSSDGVRWLPRHLSSVSFESTGTTADVRSTVRLHFRGRSFVLRDLTPGDLQALGIDVQERSYTTDIERHAYVGYGDQNRVGALEFTFADGKLRRFLGRCSDSTQCDFELSWPDRRQFRLPVAEADARVVFAPVLSVKNTFGF